MLAGIFALLHFILFIYALIKILGSSLSAGGKLLWILVVLFFPLFGLLAYLFFGQKE